MPTIEYTRPQLYRKQEEAIFCKERYGIIEASTKSGKTVGCLVWLLEQAMKGGPGTHYWWIAPVSVQASIAFGRLKRWLPDKMYRANEALLTITLPNDARIWFKSGDKPNSLYGEDVFALVIDEASRCKAEVFEAARSVVTATRGPMRIIGNVRDKKNWAYRLALRAQTGAKNMHYARITAYDAVEAGVLDIDEIEDARAQLPERVFKALYLAIPDDDGSNPFGLEAIKDCIRPLSSLRPICWGWDLGKSIDYTVGTALDRNASVCAFHRYQRDWDDTLLHVRTTTGRLPSFVDSTGLGDPVLTFLTRKGRYPNFNGYKFTRPSKTQLIESLIIAVQNREIFFPDGPIREEMESFEYVFTKSGGVTYSAPEGAHDDCVISLALSNLARSLPRTGSSILLQGSTKGWGYSKPGIAVPSRN